MAEHKSHRHKKQGGKSFRILPVIFCAGTILITLALIAAAPDTIRSAAGIAFSDAKKDYSTAYENIYVPLDEGETAETVTNVNGKPEIDPDCVEYPAYGVCFGQLSVKDCGVDCPLFMGDGDIALSNGAGVYYGSFIPGYGRTTLIAGHNNTFFNGLKNAKSGQEITIKTGYGIYRYKIKETAAKDESDAGAYDLSADKENLVLYTCYPFDEVGLTDKRFFVYADLVDGIPIGKQTAE